MPKTRKSDKKSREYKVSGSQILDKVRQIIREGNARRIIIKNEKGNILMEIPVTFAVIGTVFAPVLAAVGALAGILTKCTIVVEKKA